MKTKKLKIIFITCILLIVSAFMVNVKAVETENTSNSTQNSTSYSGNTSNSTTNTTSYDDTESTGNATSFENYTGVADNTATTTVSNYSPNSELGISGILNILLIAVGILLILLAIAIILKINK